jgi:signal transduction histidine kinase
LAFAKNKELQRAKDDLLSIASHQLRTPATGVKQYIGMLREGYGGTVSTRQKRLLNEAYNSNERQLGIIDEILHVARIDTGRLVLQKERIKIRSIVDQILREQAKAIKDKSQRILTKFPSKILYANGDPQYVRMALENIISNAIKYTPEGGKVTIKIRRQQEFAAIVVSDNGVGIDKKDMDLLFQKFSRIPNELSRQTAGSGVGLYIAQQLVEMHGGSIEVTSAAGKGTTFTILLPLALRSQQKEEV